jgi:hypothetical protein
MALCAFSSTATSATLFTTTVAIPAPGTAKILTLQQTANIQFASSIGETQVQEVFSSLINNEALDQARGEKIWKDIEPLFGLWADDEETDDHWLNNLRASSSRRLRDLYATESD